MGKENSTHIFGALETMTHQSTGMNIEGWNVEVTPARAARGPGRPKGGIMTFLRQSRISSTTTSPPPALNANIQTHELTYTCEGKRIALILIYWAPATAGEDHEFFDHLEQHVITVQQKYWVLLMGDANARHTQWGDKTNRRGKRLLSLIESNGLCRLQPKGTPPWTFISHRGGVAIHSICDHAFISEQAAHAVDNAQLRHNPRFGSDHSMIQVTLRPEGKRGGLTPAPRRFLNFATSEDDRSQKFATMSGIFLDRWFEHCDSNKELWNSRPWVTFEELASQLRSLSMLWDDTD